MIYRWSRVLRTSRPSWKRRDTATYCSRCGSTSDVRRHGPPFLWLASGAHRRAAWLRASFWHEPVFACVMAWSAAVADLINAFTSGKPCGIFNHGRLRIKSKVSFWHIQKGILAAILGIMLAHKPSTRHWHRRPHTTALIRSLFHSRHPQSGRHLTLFSHLGKTSQTGKTVKPKNSKGHAEAKISSKNMTRLLSQNGSDYFLMTSNQKIRLWKRLFKYEGEWSKWGAAIIAKFWHVLNSRMGRRDTWNGRVILRTQGKPTWCN